MITVWTNLLNFMKKFLKKRNNMDRKAKNRKIIFDWMKCDDCDWDKRIQCSKHHTIFDELDFPDD